MSLTTVGLNHKTAPIAVREKVSFLHDTLNEALCDLIKSTGINEAYILSTCNRTEVYSDAQSKEVIMRWLASNRHLASADLLPHTYFKNGSETIRHLLRVACGLDSMALGEPQIFGQMKNAYQMALSANALGQQLHGLLERVSAPVKKFVQKLKFMHIL